MIFMRIAFFTNTILEHGGGLEKYFIETAVALTERYPELEVTIVTFDEKRTEMLQHLLSVYYMKKMPVQNIYREKTEDIMGKIGRVRYIKCHSFAQVKSELKKANVIYSKNEIIDLSILKYFGHDELPPIIAGVHTPIFYPIALSFHSKLHNFLYGGFLYSFLLKGLSGVHVTNESNMNLLKKMGFSGVVTKIFNPFSFQDKSISWNRSDTFRVLFVGRINREKGIDLFIDCVHALSYEENFSKYEFKIAGSGDVEFIKKLKALDAAYENVQYVGHVLNTAVDALYDWADIVLIPSHFETANYVALEAGANGKVVLASNIPGPQDIIQDGETGYLLPLDVKVFVQKIKELFGLKIREPQVLEKIGLNAKERVRTCFDPEILYSQFYSMLQDIAEQKVSG